MSTSYLGEVIVTEDLLDSLNYSHGKKYDEKVLSSDFDWEDESTGESQVAMNLQELC